MDDRERAVRVARQRQADIPFYRELYGDRDITAESFTDLPMLTDADLAAVGTGSGVTGLAVSPEPEGAVPVTRTGADYERMEETFSRYAAHHFVEGSTTLVLFDPRRTAVELVVPFRAHGRDTVIGDARDLGATAELVSGRPVDTVYATAGLAGRFGEQLAETAGTGDIDRVVVAGPLTGRQRQHLQEVYGDVTVSQTYGSVATGFTGFQCDDLAGTNRFHTFTDQVHEVVDPETGEPLPPGETGELVTTTLWNGGMAFTRYRTGDAATLTHQDCTCDTDGPVITYRGAARFAGLRLQGIRIHREQVEEAVMSLRDLAGDRYRVHAVEGEDGPGLRLDLERRRTFAEPDAVRRTAEQRAMDALTVGSGTSWRDLVERGVVAPITVRFHDRVEGSGTVTDHRFGE